MMRKRLSTGVYDTVPEDLRKLPPLPIDVLVRVVLPILAVLACVLYLVGCAHAPTVGDAMKGGQLAMGFVREASAELEPVHHAGTEAAIAYCKLRLPAEYSEDEANACLAGVGFSPDQIAEHKAALEQLTKAYDSIAQGLAAIESAWPVLQRMVDRAKAVQR